jgi:hypothetical protein
VNLALRASRGHDGLRFDILDRRRRDSSRLRSPTAAAPRADQPLIDMVEYAVPSLRTLYFTRAEEATFVDASEYAERYRIEAERLNELEKRNRTEGEALDDFSVGRISSFLKSYGEMRKGEQFVMGEVRARPMEHEFGLARVRSAVCPSSMAAPVGASGASSRPFHFSS